MPLAAGGLLTPTLEAGLRYDGGDAETGSGLEIASGLGYSVGRLTAQIKARMLAAHEDAGYKEWGFSSSVHYQPGADGRGLKLRLGSAWGVTQSGVQSMWTRDAAQGFSSGHSMAAGRRYETEFGYGIIARQYRESLWTPFLTLQSTQGGEDLTRLGLRLVSGLRLEATLEIERRRDTNGIHQHAIGLQGRYSW